MSDHLIRIYQRKDISEIKKHLLIYGDLGGACANCQNMEVAFNAGQCPECSTEFKYITFRNIKSHIPKVHKLFEERPDLVIIDFEDYRRNEGASKAENFFK